MTRDLQKYFHSPFDSFSPAADSKESSCSDSLAFTLSLNIEEESYQVPGANIKQCELRAFSYGFDCVLGFYLPNEQRKDDLFSAFTSDSLITVELGITGVINMSKPPPKVFKVTGLVKDKSLSEFAYRQVAGNPVLYRYYQIEFADPAQVLWQQHYPCELHVKDSMSSVINAQVVSPIELTIDFAAADKVQPLICLALGNAEKNSPGETGVGNHVSFYDFLMAYCDKHNAFFVYDYAKQNYCLKGDSPDLETGTAFLPHEISDLKIYWPAAKRSTTNLLNGIAAGSKQSAIENKNAVVGIKQDIVLRQAIENQFSERKALETNKISILGEQLDVHFSRWPLQTFWPNCELNFNSTVNGKKYFYTDKRYRSYAFFISAKAKDNTPEHDLDLPFTQYELQYQVKAHNSTIEQPILPLYRKPSYPLYVEGVVVSEQGSGDEKTFDVASNTETGQFEYKVHIPLWDKTIQIILEPDFLNSHFYFPFFRGAKLLLGLELHRAHIQKVLSWGEGVQLPLATQGNHILFGKKTGDETSLSHVYEDSKPVFAIKRSKDKDTELIRMEEGSIIFQTCEEK